MQIINTQVFVQPMQGMLHCSVARRQRSRVVSPGARLKIRMCCVDVSNTFLKSQLVCFLPVEILTRCGRIRLHFLITLVEKSSAHGRFLHLQFLRGKLPDALHSLRPFCVKVSHESLSSVEAN